jgi:hypothetical protein
MARAWPIVLVLGALARPALAGPPYISDDPEPTDTNHFEIYSFNQGTATRSGTSGMAGIDFNYGAAPDLQLTAMLPAGFNSPTGEQTSIGMTNIELAAKYRFLHQDTFGLDVSFFPRVFLPSGSNSIGLAAPGYCCRSGCRRIGVAAGPPSAAADAWSAASAPRIFAWPEPY